ncbi:MAG: cytochrome c oxidase subunit 3 [Terracidiphilus sp.]|jgi:cytochrome c oxidase subunit 3
MPATFTPSPSKKKRRDPGTGGLPPVVRRPTGGDGEGGDGGGDNWRNERGGPRELLLRVRSAVFVVLAADMVFFGILVSIFFARQTGTHMDPRTHFQVGDWHPVKLPPILFLNTVALLLSSLTMELARRRIFHEIDALEEWLGLGRPALHRALPWLGATLMLGMLFLAGQWTAWKQLTAQGFAWNQNSTPASNFIYLITEMHAAHLLFGIAALAVCLCTLGWLKRVEFRQIAVDATAWYWHAMSLIWVLLLGVLALGQ